MFANRQGTSWRDKFEDAKVKFKEISDLFMKATKE